MKKKILWIVVPIITVISVVTVILSAGKGIINDQIEYTEVYRGSFQRQKKLTGTVDSKKHYYYFPGNIVEIYKNIGEEVNKKETILKYTDMYGYNKKLLSAVKGIVTEISSGQVAVNDYEYYISCNVDIETRNRLKLHSQHLFETYNDTCLTELEHISSYGQSYNNQLQFEIRLKIVRGKDVLLKQQGTVFLNLEQLDNVLLVDRRALMKDEKGYYLLDSQWLNDTDNINDYRIDISVIEMDDTTAVIDGIDIENIQVLILSDSIKELLK